MTSLSKVCLLCCSLLAAACAGPIVQKPVEAKSGLYVPVPAAGGWWIPGELRSEYNGLVDLYGRGKSPTGVPNFVPSLHEDDGVEARPGGPFPWFIDDVHMKFFGRMAGWKRQNRAP